MKDQAQGGILTTPPSFTDYINERGGRVLMKAIEEPQNEWESSLDAIRSHAYETRTNT